MKVLQSLLLVLALIVIAVVVAVIPGGQTLIGKVLPYLAFAVFLGGFIAKVVGWSRSPVPFRIPTTAGQEDSLPWIKPNRFDNPSTTFGVIVRMLLEVTLFRSLFRNTKAEIHEGPKLVYGSSKYLWLFALIFHYSFLVVVLRHLRFFLQPVPAFVRMLNAVDGFLQVLSPSIQISGFVLVLGVLLLLFRRMIRPQIRYISLVNDYFPLLLIFSIAVTGILMRYFMRVDIVNVKQLVVGLTTFHPVIPGQVGTIFFVHLFLVCCLMAYFPFSKLMHMGGVFLSPTRNMANNNRKVRHVNPWNDPAIKPHSYEAYEDEFREVMKEAEIPVEKE
jgi:nitrate reductase gamma subunit